MHIRNLTFTILLTLISSFVSTAQMSVIPFVTAVNRVTDIQNCGDDRIFIVEQVGRIRIANLQGVLNTANFLNIQSKVGSSGNEQGLLGLAFSPNYANDRRFYLNYTNLQGTTVIARYTTSATNPDSCSATSEEILFTISQPYSNHNGGSMQFGPDGYLYIGMGDGGSAGDPGNRSQNLQNPLGKILRIDVNTPTGYGTPQSNPYFGVPNTDQRIWASGVRNPWRTSFDKITGDYWIADVGQNLWEEVDFQPAGDPGGNNYGWRCYEGNAAYNTAGCQPASSYDAPVHVLSHSSGACSITGGYVYRGAQYSNWFGKYFFTDYCTGTIQSLNPNGSGGFTVSTYGTFSTFAYTTFGVDRYGEMYIGRNSTGVYKIVDASCLPVAFITLDDTITACGNNYDLKALEGVGFQYQWYSNGSAIAGADSSVYNATTPGYYYVTVVNSQFCSATSDSIYVDFVALPTINFSIFPSQVCEGFPTIGMIGLPQGGTFTGPGVSGSTFNPQVAGVGTHDVTYTYTDPNTGCSASGNSSVIVSPLPTVSLSGLPAQVCVYNPSFTLNGSPAGGLYSGVGVTGNSFDPNTAGLGTYNVTYTYSDSLGCVDSATVTVVVDACVSVPEINANNGIVIMPNPANANETLLLQISQQGAASVEVFDAIGKMIHQSMHTANGTIELPLSISQAGIYLVKITDMEGNQRSARFTIR
ncbi:MAG: PQQ-dependent sugar dehydrogenase [Bacteroidota bacterium]